MKGSIIPYNYQTTGVLNTAQMTTEGEIGLALKCIEIGVDILESAIGNDAVGIHAKR